MLVGGKLAISMLVVIVCHLIGRATELICGEGEDLLAFGVPPVSETSVSEFTLSSGGGNRFISDESKDSKGLTGHDSRKSGNIGRNLDSPHLGGQLRSSPVWAGDWQGSV